MRADNLSGAVCGERRVRSSHRLSTGHWHARGKGTPQDRIHRYGMTRANHIVDEARWYRIHRKREDLGEKHRRTIQGNY